MRISKFVVLENFVRKRRGKERKGRSSFGSEWESRAGEGREDFSFAVINFLNVSVGVAFHCSVIIVL